jgi:drug/metabolite transporter (DMT)-like permease
MIDTIQSLVGRLTGLAIAVAVVIAIGMILWAWVVKRTVSAVIGVIILAAIVLFAITSTDWLRERVGDDLDARAPTAVVEVAGRPAGEVV